MCELVSEPLPRERDTLDIQRYRRGFSPETGKARRVLSHYAFRNTASVLHRLEKCVNVANVQLFENGLMNAVLLAVCISILHCVAIAVGASRLWLRYRSSRMWWDDYLVILPVLFDIFYWITLLAIPRPGPSKSSFRYRSFIASA